MAQVQRTYDKNGKLESECFEINGIKMARKNHTMKMDN
jgi:hypothetical protein